uniref:Uncharacterized protein n=1 Tax=Glossina pallidipes TaxID=7398 RepID=A0A1A9Z5M6_GLOPL
MLSKQETLILNLQNEAFDIDLISALEPLFPSNSRRPEDFEKTRESSESDQHARNCKDSKTEAIAKSTSIITDKLAVYGIILLLYYDCCHHTAVTATGAPKS